MKILNIAKLIFANQANLNKLCLGGASEEFEKAIFSHEKYPCLNMLLSNSPKFQVMMDSLGGSIKDRDKFFQETYPEIQTIEEVLQKHRGKIYNNLIESEKYNLSYKELDDLAYKLFIEKSDNILNNLLPRLNKIIVKNIEKEINKENTYHYEDVGVLSVADPKVLEAAYKKALENKQDYIVGLICRNPNTPEWILDVELNGDYASLAGVASNDSITEDQAYKIATMSGSKKITPTMDSVVKTILLNNKTVHNYKKILDYFSKLELRYDLFSAFTNVPTLTEQNLLDLLEHSADSHNEIKKILFHNAAQPREDFWKQVVEKSSNTRAKEIAEEYLKKYYK